MNGGNGEVKLISLQYNDENFCPENNLVTIDYSWLGESNPHSKYSFNSLIGDASEETGQKAIINQYQLFPFKMNVLDPFRTFCEKIMSLVRFSYSDDPIVNLSKKVKHVYDLYQLLQYEKFQHFIQSGKPMQNGYIERFNRSYRKEILDAYLFFNLSEVREHTQEWMDEYNNNRPHEGLGNLTPTELSKNIRHQQQINQLVM